MLRNFILRLIINAITLAAIVTVFRQGIRIDGLTRDTQLQTLLAIALIFGIVNAFVKPVLKFLTCPFIFFTLGLFLLVINGAMFMLTAALSESLLVVARLEVDNFGWAILGGAIMSVVGMISEKLLGLDDNTRTVTEVRYVERRQPSTRREKPPQFPPPTPPDDSFQPPYMPPDDKPKRR